jgi:DNA-binding XRE family transcriptional regulator
MPRKTSKKTLVSSKNFSIKARRLELGFSQRGLAKVAGLSGTVVGQMERGKYRGKFATRTKLARALKIPVQELLSKKERKFFDSIKE